LKRKNNQKSKLDLANEHLQATLSQKNIEGERLFPLKLHQLLRLEELICIS
jgi:hypothetical protein